MSKKILKTLILSSSKYLHLTKEKTIFNNIFWNVFNVLIGAASGFSSR